MKEFQLASEKAHFFVLVDFAKDKVLQLIHIEKNTNTINASVLLRLNMCYLYFVYYSLMILRQYPMINGHFID